MTERFSRIAGTGSHLPGPRIDNATLALAKADMYIAQRYSELTVDDDARADADVPLGIVRWSVGRVGFYDGREQVHPAFPCPAAAMLTSSRALWPTSAMYRLPLSKA